MPLALLSQARAAHVFAPVLLLAVLIWGPLAAQQDPQVPQAAEQAPPAAEQAPAPSQDAGEINQTLSAVEALRTQLEANDRSAALTTRLEDIETGVTREIDDRLLAAPLAQADRRQLEELRLAVSRQRTDLTRLSRDLNAAITDAEAIRESFRGYAGTWIEQPREVEARDLPPAILAVIERVIAQIDAGQTAARDYLGVLVALQSRLVAMESRLGSLEEQAVERERTLIADVFQRDSGRLWTTLTALGPAQMRADLARVSDTVAYAYRDLLDVYPDRLILHALILVAVLILLLLTRRSRVLVAHPEFKVAHRALAHPFAVSLVLTLPLVQALYPTAQPPVWILGMAVFIVAELVVLGVVLRRLSAGALWVAGAFLVLARLAYLLPFDTPLQRIAVLFSALGGIALLAGTWRFASRRPDFEAWRGRKVARAIVVSFGGLLAAAIAANLLGAVGLAIFVTQGVTIAYLTALGLLTISLVLRDLVGLALATGPLHQLRSIRWQVDRITGAAHKVILWLAVTLWAAATLRSFGALDFVLGGIRGALDASFQVGQVTIAPGTILVFLLSIWVAVYVSRLTRFFLDEDVLPRLSLPRGVPGAISTGIHYLIIAGAIVFGTAAAGLDFSNFAIVVGALSVGIGFGLQNIVNNFISGVILLFERPIQIGDNVQVGELVGTVKQIGIRASIVRTYDGSEVIVPNGDLIAQQVVNYTLSDRNRRLELLVGVAYGSDLDHAKATIEAALPSVENVIAEPPPMVLFQGFGESSLDFRVLFWIADYDKGLRTRSAVGMAIYRALNAAKIEIPFPQRDLHIRSAPGLSNATASAKDPPGAESAQ